MKPSPQQAGPGAGANITLARKAKQVEAWLAALAPDDALATAVALRAYLAAHDRPAVSAGLRRQLYDVLSGAIRATLDALAAELCAMRLPLAGRQLEQVEGAVGLLDAVAEFHRRLLADASESARPFLGAGRSAAHLSAILHARLETMAACHLSHLQLPEGFWLAVNQVGQQLFQSGLAAAADPARPSARLGEAFLALHLEANADPYHLSDLERAWTLEIIARHGALATVAPAAHAGVFGIRVGHDAPAYPLARQPDAAPACDLIVDTAPLVRRLALMVNRIARGGPPESDLPAAGGSGYLDLLRRLQLAWSGVSQRMYARRHPATPGRHRLVVGFAAILRQLANPDAPSTAAQCSVLDASPGGMALWVARPTFALQVGSPVWVCGDAAAEDCELGLVRWFKTAPDGSLSFGLRCRHGAATPGLWYRTEDLRPRPCLLLAPDSARADGVPLLVVAAGELAPEAPVMVRLGGAERRLEVSRRVEASQEIEIFRCVVAGP